VSLTSDTLGLDAVPLPAHTEAMATVQQARQGELETARTADLLRLLPRGRKSVLDVGARDGHFSRLLAGYFDEVTALDLEKPAFEFPRVATVAGDLTHLQFPDGAFDCAFCAEVLEHISALEQACRELARVARREIVIGVPFRQDMRACRTTCRHCGKTNPPWAHLNTFDEPRLQRLFPGTSVRAKSFVGETSDFANSFSTVLMDWAGNPWGSYDQEEPCIYCGAALVPPDSLSTIARAFAGAAVRLNRLQASLSHPHPYWIHIVFAKDGSAAHD
jgi:SAM-dependent methyltransferase